MIDKQKLQEAVEVMHDLSRSLQLHSRGLDEVEEKRTQMRLTALYALIEVAQSYLSGEIGEMASEDKVAFGIFKAWNRFDKQEAEDKWTAKHYESVTKTMSGQIAKALVGKIRR